MSQKLNRFYEYLHKYERLVMTNAGKFVDAQLAEDVTQDTFIKMYERINYLDDDTVKQWLIVVSGNIAKDYLKKGGCHKAEAMAPTDLEYLMEKYTESAEESYERKAKQKAALELCRTACHLLYEKNPNWYYIMVDSCILGMSSAEISTVLEISSDNVDVMKSRARKYLRKTMGKEYHDFF